MSARLLLLALCCALLVVAAVSRQPPPHHRDRTSALLCCWHASRLAGVPPVPLSACSHAVPASPAHCIVNGYCEKSRGENCVNCAEDCNTYFDCTTRRVRWAPATTMHGPLTIAPNKSAQRACLPLLWSCCMAGCVRARLHRLLPLRVASLPKLFQV